MVDELEEILEKNIEIEEFKTIEDLAYGLLDKNVDAIVYNAAFTDVKI